MTNQIDKHTKKVKCVFQDKSNTKVLFELENLKKINYRNVAEESMDPARLQEGSEQETNRRRREETDQYETHQGDEGRINELKVDGGHVCNLNRLHI